MGFPIKYIKVYYKRIIIYYESYTSTGIVYKRVLLLLFIKGLLDHNIKTDYKTPG